METDYLRDSPEKENDEFGLPESNSHMQISPELFPNDRDRSLELAGSDFLLGC